MLKGIPKSRKFQEKERFFFFFWCSQVSGYLNPGFYKLNSISVGYSNLSSHFIGLPVGTLGPSARHRQFCINSEIHPASMPRKEKSIQQLCRDILGDARLQRSAMQQIRRQLSAGIHMSSVC
jgi:hypothetical protein